MRKNLLTKITLACIVSSLVFQPILLFASNSFIIDSSGDFLTGSIDSNLNESSGALSLKPIGFTENTSNQFNESSRHQNTTVGLAGQGEVKLNQGYYYGIDSTPGLTDEYIYTSLIIEATNKLYVGTFQGGLNVVDLNTNSIDKIYSTTSTPPILGNSITNLHYDELNNYLYIASTGAGISVLDLDDETIVTTYSTSTTPALVGNSGIRDIEIYGVHLYVATLSGVTKINLDTNTHVKNYTTLSTPALANNNSWKIFIDPTTEYLYISSFGGGITAIDTNDDTLINLYNTSSTPPIAGVNVPGMLYHDSTRRLYINTTEGVSVLDLDTDTIVKTYNKISTPILEMEYTFVSFINENTNRLYIGGYDGLTEFNLSNDTLVRSYDRNSEEGRISGSNVYHFSLNAAGDKLYVSTSEGLSVLNLDGKYAASGSYTSKAIALDSIPQSKVSWNETKVAGQNVSVQVRTGDENAALINNFDDGDSSEYLGDYLDWGAAFQNAQESNGTLKLTNPIPSVWLGSHFVWFWIGTGKPANYFPIGTNITARIRVVSENDTPGNAYGYMYDEEWWSNSLTFTDFNQWHILDLKTTVTSSAVGFQVGWEIDSWNNATDYFEIDWLRIELPDTYWDDWSEACTTSQGCQLQTIDTEDKYLQYRINLETNNLTSTPSVNSISISEYPATGTYTSKVFNSTNVEKWNKVVVNATKPTGTNIRYYTRTGTSEIPDSSWESWREVSEAGQIASGSKPYLQVRAVLETSNDAVTPTLSKLTIEYTNKVVSTNTQTPTSPTAPVSVPVIFDFNIQESQQTDTTWVVKNTNPVFKGRTFPNSLVEITINSDPIYGTTYSDSEGYWEWTPDVVVPNGNHNITINVKHNDAIYTRYYALIVEAQSDSTPETPSPTPTPTPSPTPKPTPIVVNEDEKEKSSLIYFIVGIPLLLLVIIGSIMVLKRSDSSTNY